MQISIFYVHGNGISFVCCLQHPSPCPAQCSQHRHRSCRGRRFDRVWFCFAHYYFPGKFITLNAIKVNWRIRKCFKGLRQTFLLLPSPLYVKFVFLFGSGLWMSFFCFERSFIRNIIPSWARRAFAIHKVFLFCFLCCRWYQSLISTVATNILYDDAIY